VASESVGFFLQIGTDPTLWSVSDDTPGALAKRLEQAAGPVAVRVSGPLKGRLLLSARATTAWIGAPGGTHPIGELPKTRPVIYLPSITAATMYSGYPLDPSETLAGLEKQISTAMADEKSLIVKLSGGQLVLGGATLAFVVLAEGAQ
jgi:hypothetical protein